MIEALGMPGGKVAILDFKIVKACRLRTKGFFEETEKHVWIDQKYLKEIE